MRRDGVPAAMTRQEGDEVGAHPDQADRVARTAIRRIDRHLLFRHPERVEARTADHTYSHALCHGQKDIPVSWVARLAPKNLDRPEEPIAKVTQAGHYVSALVQAVVDGRRNDVDMGVAVPEAGYALGRRHH